MRMINKLSLFLILMSSVTSLYAGKISFEINEKGLSIKERERHKSFHWEAYRGMIPRHAVIGGEEFGRTLYICQAPYAGGIHPGKVVDGRCNITYAGREIPQPVFHILVGKGVHWMRSYPGEMPMGMVSGGSENGHPLFVCQARVGRSMHPGKLVEDHCNIGFDGREVEKMDYRILTSSYTSHPRDMNDGYGSSRGGRAVYEASPADRGYGSSSPSGRGGYGSSSPSNSGFGSQPQR